VGGWHKKVADLAKVDDYRSLRGAQKAAIVMLALGEEQCGRLFTMMHEDEIRDISAAMAQLGAVRAEIVERLCTDFVESLGSSGSLIGSYESTETLLSKTLPRDRVSQIMEEIRGPAGRTMWDKLGNVNEDVLANYLKNEYPQTVAVVLSKIRPEHAANVLTLLPDPFAMEVVMRMLRMETVQKEVLDGVERTLRAEFMSNLARSARRDSHELMAEIFNNLDRAAETRFVSGLEERNRESAEKIKSLMFTFDDLQRLAGPAVQTLLRSVEKDKLPIALKGASDKIKELFLSNMSERAGKMLREDISALGPVRLRDVDEAQSGIVNLAKDLAAQGQIEIGGNADDEVVY
jgi:flagellar motor switch protein FliG